MAVPIEQCWYALVEGELDDRDRLTAGAIFQARLRAGLWNLLSIPRMPWERRDEAREISVWLS